MAYWILQANPEIYRIFDALKDPEAIRTWTIAHHRQVIAVGDEFALWASGPKGGICAFGVVNEPADFRLDDSDPYCERPAEPNEPEWLIGVKITELVKPPIPRSEIAADAALASMPSSECPVEAIRSLLMKPSGRQSVHTANASSAHAKTTMHLAGPMRKYSRRSAPISPYGTSF